MPSPNKPIWPWLLAVVGGCALAMCLGVCGLGLGVVAVAAKAKQQALQPPPGIATEYDVVYDVAEGESLTMDVARPASGTGSFPAVVCIHGGGWRGGDKTAFRALIHLLAQRGFVAVSVKYRFAPAHHFPAQLADVKSAVRFLRTKEQAWQVDPERVGAMGASAGGHLALLLGTTDESDGLEGTGNLGPASAVRAVASLVGPTDLTAEFPPIVQPMLRDLVNGDSHQALERASPIHYVDASDAPLLLIYGTADPLVPYSQATALLAACQKVSLPAELITIPNGGHGSGGNLLDWHNANNRLVEFFEEQLK